MRCAAALALAVLVAGCQPDELGYGPKHQRPLSMEMRGRINDLGMRLYAPILIRIFKEESTLEVWKRKRSGKYALLKSYEICKWSGKLGPKVREGDRQAPEGFYAIRPAQMNPNSQYHLSFNLGFPNPYDRAHGRTGSHLMVHGACSSRGCYAMEDAQIQEIYALARDAFKGGQRAFQVQAYPFRMTPENMARHHASTHMAFWKMLKEGYDHFEITRMPPKVDYCGRRYVFNAASGDTGLTFSAGAACPVYTVPDSLAVAVASKQKKDAAETERLVAVLADRRQREAAWKRRETAIAAALGAKKTTAVAGIDGTAPSSTGGTPVPKAAPRAVAADDGGSGTGSFLSGLSGLFGDDETPAAPESVASTATVPDAPIPPADVPATREAETDGSSVLTRWLGLDDPKDPAPDAEPEG